jgi:hypothetical protein
LALGAGSGGFLLATRGPATLAACAKRGIEPDIATGRDPHHPSWQQRFAPLPDPPAEDASLHVKMAYQLKTAVGKAIDGARKCTVEPVIGIIKEVLGFRQFSDAAGPLRRLASGVWSVWFSISSVSLPYLGCRTGATASFQPEPHGRTDRVLPGSKLHEVAPAHVYEGCVRYQSDWRDRCLILSDKLLG